MKNLKIIFLIAFCSISFIYSFDLKSQDKNNLSKQNEKQQSFTLSDFGLKLKNHHIDFQSMTLKQRDTILIGMFDFNDLLYDIAVYHKSREKIIVYRNAGNGTLTYYREISLKDKDVTKIELIPPKDFDLNPNQRDGIGISFSGGSQKKISNNEILFPDKFESKTPLGSFLDDGRVFLYDLNFIEQWRSDRNFVADPCVTVGDVDKDGKNEAIYTFWPNGNAYPTHLVVFECVNQNQYRIDWDTLLTQGGLTFGYKLTDFDRDGNKEFLGKGREYLTGYMQLGTYECSGQGKYRFRSAGVVSAYLAYPGSIEIRDTVTVINGTKTGAGFWVCYSNNTSPYNTSFQKYCFNQKNFNYLNFFDDIPGDIKGGSYYVYSLAVADIDKDGREEVVEGDTQWGTNYIGYWDSTGTPNNKGYEYKVITPNAPVSGGYLIGKDLDNDGYKEITACGIGYASGSIGTVKHTGSPGQNQFTTVWWDSAGVRAMPNYGIDTASINGKYSILFPTVVMIAPNGWPVEQLHCLTYTRNGTYNLRQTGRLIRDSMAFIGARLIDIDNDGYINIMAPMGRFLQISEYFFSLSDWESTGMIGINPITVNIPLGFQLYQNYPNPFNSQTVIKYEIPKKSNIKISIFDITGKEVYNLFNGTNTAGKYSLNFNSANLSSGIYFYVLYDDNNIVQSKKMIILK